ncbi:MAG: ATP-binding protein, partial [Deltaproteobacteria bacterium]|nr:ATP-binding protein [Deltaproteobacteria bacterium]
FRLCQRVLAKGRGALVLFDEIEDVFPRQISRLFGLMSSGSDKSWTNRLLESNPVPTLWVGNDIDQVDTAFLRRFDLIIELLTPPPQVRRRILESHCGRLRVGADWLTRVARDERLHPGHIERATRVAKTIAPRGAAETEQLLSRVIDGNLRACGGKGGSSQRIRSDACAYDLSLVNATMDLERLVEGLARSRSGTLCLYGPPGTGKSAFVATLADRLGLPLHSRRASDLISCYVGSTEANLARMFRQAKAQQALLFLDEADSFLQDRRRAQRSWEITEVNELLVQMESFEGIFVCATNLIDTLDQAVFRRFALKARLDPLTPEQRWRMLAATLERLGAKLAEGETSAELRRKLDRLASLTPGDFAAVARRTRLLGEATDGAGFVVALQEECTFKDSERRPVGFVREGPRARQAGTGGS